MSEWQPSDILRQQLEAKRWTVKRISVEGGCYEAHVVDADGKRITASFNPKTLNLVRTSQKGGS